MGTLRPVLKSMSIKNEAIFYTAIMCLMVIYIHVTSEVVNNYDKNSIFYALVFVTNKLCSFVVPGFIFISSLKYFSGFSQNPSKKFHYAKFIKGRLLKIYIPYLFWVLIYYLIFISKGYFPFQAKDLAHYIFYGDLAANFYFVIIIMQFYLLMPLWRVLSRASGITEILTVIFTGVIITYIVRINFNAYLYNDRVLTSYLIYWVAGIFCGIYYERFLSFCKKFRLINCLLYLTLATAHIYLCYIASKGLFYYKYAEHIHILFCFVSAIFIYDLSVVASNISLLKIFRLLSDSSYYIYLSHVILIILVDLHMSNLSIPSRLALKSGIAFTIPAFWGILYVFIKSKFSRSKT